MNHRIYNCLDCRARVVYMDENVEYMRDVVGYDCKELKPNESEDRTRELNVLLKKLYEKYKVET